MTPRFAWPTYKERWDTRVSGLLIDGQEASDYVDNDYLRINASERSWDSVEFNVSVSTDEVLPSGLTDQSAHVLIACAATQVRRAYPMDPASAGNGFEAKVAIPRASLARKASVGVQIVAQSGGRRRLVGSALEWTLVIEAGEAPTRPTGTPPLNSVWIDFAENAAPPEARRNPTGYAYVDMGQSPPVLYLNSGIDGFQSLIMADNAKTERRRHRDVLGSTVARQVAGTVFRAAFDEVTPGDYGAAASGPTIGLLKRMCDAIAAELPDTESAEDLYEKIANLSGNPGATASFWTDVDLILDRITGLSDAIVRTCAEVKHV